MQQASKMMSMASRTSAMGRMMMPMSMGTKMIQQPARGISLLMNDQFLDED